MKPVLSSQVKPNLCKIEWKYDGLYRSYVDGLPIVNLHIHSKNFSTWKSDSKKIKY
jgi:hypothetical protein